MLHSIILLKCGQVAESENTLRQFIARHGETGTVLTNLVKVFAERGEQELVADSLWRALQLDPNLDNAVSWYEAIHREKQGEAAGHDALRRCAPLPGAWRARLWIARNALEARDPGSSRATAMPSDTRDHIADIHVHAHGMNAKRRFGIDLKPSPLRDHHSGRSSQGSNHNHRYIS